MPITPAVLDELLKEYKTPEDMLGNDGLLQQLTKALVERALEGEMTHHLGYRHTMLVVISPAIPETVNLKRPSPASAGGWK